MQEFNNVPSTGKYGDSIAIINQNFLMTHQAMQMLKELMSPNPKYVTVEATSQTTDVHSVLPATGAKDTIYRVGKWDGAQYNVTCYTEYGWNGTDYVGLAVKEYTLATSSDFNNPTPAQKAKVATVGSILDGADSVPTAGSGKLVTSGGVVSNLSSMTKDLYDISSSPAEYGKITGYYIKPDNTIGTTNYGSLYYRQVNKGEIVNAVSESNNALLYKTEPTSSSTYDGYVASGNSFAMPFNGYVMVYSSKDAISPQHGIYIRNTGQIINFEKRTDRAFEYVSNIYNALFWKAPVTQYLNGYINASGVHQSYSSSTFRTLYVYVLKGMQVEFSGGISDTMRAGFVKTQPTNGFSLDKIIATDTTSPYIAECDGYFCISGVASSVQLSIATLQDLKIQAYGNKIVPTGVIDNAYIYKTGSWYIVQGLHTSYFAVTEGEYVEISKKNNNNQAEWAFFTNVPTSSTTPTKVSAGDETIIRVPADGYIALSRDEKKDEWMRRRADLNDVIVNLQLQAEYKTYYNKTCLYIGDSISTKDNYKWKGYIEQAYALKYARDISGQLAPANGGITVIPTEGDASLPLINRSIWYRCAENRMSIYDFDIISLFGGTNDISNNLIVGTTDDIPYVDDADSFDTPSAYTDTWTDSLTLAQCLMGCIEMLKRDFPTKEIVLCTIYPMEQGNQTYTPTGTTMAAAIAELQVKIAVKYGLKVVPFFWDAATAENATRRVFTSDGVHPNTAWALRMRAKFAETLCL